MVKAFKGNDLAAEALTPTAADRNLNLKDALAHLLTGCSPFATSTQVGVAAVRRLIEAEATIADQLQLIGALQEEARLLREELSQTPRGASAPAAGPAGRRRSIYLASSWRNRHQPAVLAALRLANHDVYDFRHPAPGDRGFSWKAIDGGWESWTPAQWREALNHPIAQRGYANDRRGMDGADCCVLLLPSGRSAHLEAGFMAGQGKAVYTLVLEAVEPDLMNLLLHPAEHLCTSLDELLAALSAAPRPALDDSRHWED